MRIFFSLFDDPDRVKYFFPPPPVCFLTSCAVGAQPTSPFEPAAAAKMDVAIFPIKASAFQVDSAHLQTAHFVSLGIFFVVNDGTEPAWNCRCWLLTCCWFIFGGDARWSKMLLAVSATDG